MNKKGKAKCCSKCILVLVLSRRVTVKARMLFSLQQSLFTFSHLVECIVAGFSGLHIPKLAVGFWIDRTTNCVLPEKYFPCSCWEQSWLCPAWSCCIHSCREPGNSFPVSFPCSRRGSNSTQVEIVSSCSRLLSLAPGLVKCVNRPWFPTLCKELLCSIVLDFVHVLVWFISGGRKKAWGTSQCPEAEVRMLL